MTSKSEKRARRRAQGQPPAPEAGEADAQFKPKAGPGQVIKREMIPAVGGGHSRQKRYRNVGASPLLLAYYRGVLAGPAENAPNAPAGCITADDRKNCAEKFEKWWYERMATINRDSSIPTISSGGGSRSMTENQQLAGEQIALLRERMSARNYLIVEGFVGYGHSMLDALRYAGVEAHPIGTAFRVREALDDLVCALTGRQLVPMLVPGKARKSP
jgi:hypothetical protein